MAGQIARAMTGLVVRAMRPAAVTRSPASGSSRSPVPSSSSDARVVRREVAGMIGEIGQQQQAVTRRGRSRRRPATRRAAPLASRSRIVPSAAAARVRTTRRAPTGGLGLRPQRSSVADAGGHGPDPAVALRGQKSGTRRGSEPATYCSNNLAFCNPNRLGRDACRSAGAGPYAPAAHAAVAQIDAGERHRVRGRFMRAGNHHRLAASISGPAHGEPREILPACTACASSCRSFWITSTSGCSRRMTAGP